MSTSTRDIIFTNENCINCNRCIASCEVEGANISLINNKKAVVAVNSERCVSCGACIQCKHQARDYNDDVDQFITDLAAGQKISLVVDPIFYSHYSKNAGQILGYLKNLGVQFIYNSDFGTEISFWAIVDYLKKHSGDPDAAFILNNCYAVTNKIKKYHPEYIPYIIPVQSPAQCMATYARKYRHDGNKIAYLTSCIACKEDFSDSLNDDRIEYVLTFRHLIEKIGEIDFSSFSAKADVTANDFGTLLSFISGYKEWLTMFFERTETIISMTGLNKIIFHMINDIVGRTDKLAKPLAIEVFSCVNGCQEGPGITQDSYHDEHAFREYYHFRQGISSPINSQCSIEKNTETLNSMFSELDATDFAKSFKAHAVEKVEVSPDAVNSTFVSMFKTSIESQNIDCGSCGHKTCHEMAAAVAKGWERKESCVRYMNSLLEKQLVTDFQTGLPNIRGFISYISNKVQSNLDTEYLIIAANINGISIINDLYGYEKGSVVLKKFSDQLLKYAEGRDCNVARLGADNFGICVESSVDNLEALYNLPVLNLKDQGIAYPVTARFGIYPVKDTMEEMNIIFNRASMVMSTESSFTNNTFVVFTEEMHEKMNTNILISSQMQAALENNEFHVFYQPQYHSFTENLAGAEALCRWIKPDGTMVSPAIFIPIAEKNGFIRNLDQKIWEKVFQDIRKWLDDGTDIVPVSINISRMSLVNDDLIYVIARLKEKYKIPAELVHFEITESAYINEQEAMITRINSIREMGFKIAMDDFGSGYSSLNTLKDLPIDILKLDMGFVRGEDNADKGGLIISSVVKMAQSLKLVTISEGVETNEQAEFLKSIGIDVIQGFLYSKPVSHTDYNAILASRTKAENVSVPLSSSKLDLARFYDPASSENLMFETFSGAALILEFDRRNVSLVRINKRTINIFGLPDASFSEIENIVVERIKKEGSKFHKLLEEHLFGKNSEFEYEMEVKDYISETPIWCRFRAWEIRSTGKDKHTVFVLLENITKEKLFENTLDLINTQLALLLDQKKVGYILFQVTVNLLRVAAPIKMRVLSVNSHFQEISGYSKDVVMKWGEKSALNIIHPLDRPGFMALILRAVASKQLTPFSYVYRAKRADGEYVKVKIMVSAIKDSADSYTVVTNFITL